MKIIFVEEDKIIASGLKYSLKQEGYSVFHFTNISDAEESIMTNQFDFAILD